MEKFIKPWQHLVSINVISWNKIFYKVSNFHISYVLYSWLCGLNAHFITSLKLFTSILHWEMVELYFTCDMCDNTFEYNWFLWMHIEWWHGCIFFQLNVYLVKVTLLFDAMITMFQKDGKLWKYWVSFNSQYHMIIFHRHVKVTLLFDTMITMLQEGGTLFFLKIFECNWCN